MRREQAGMTLVEVSIAAVVLAMLLTGLVTAMRSFALTYGSLEGLTQSTERLRETTSFLRHSLREAISLGPDAFQIEGSQIIWVAPLDRIGAAGGITWFKLSADGNRLLLEFAKDENLGGARLVDGSEASWGAEIAPEVLLTGVSSVEISVRPDAQAPWQEALEAPMAKLPHSVRLDFGLEQSQWPPLVVALDNFRGTN